MTSQEFNLQVNKFSKFVQGIAESMFEELGTIDSSGFALVAPDAEHPDKYKIAALVLPPEMFANDEGKSMIGEAIRAHNDELKPMAIALITEAWAVEADPDSPEADDMISGKAKPADQPNKKEVVMVSVETHASYGILTLEINRSEEKPKLEVLYDFDWHTKKPGQPHGKLQNLIPKPYVDIQETTATA